MKTLLLEPVGGIAGDMTLAALLAAGVPRAALDEALDALKSAAGAGERDLDGVQIEASWTEVNGIRALHVDVKGTDSQHHRSWRSIRALLERAALREGTKRLALRAFALLAEAEGRVHGVPADDVEFHEVGALDSIADLVGSAALVEASGAGRVLALPAPAGGGIFRMAHGEIPIPSPAVLEVLRGRAMKPSGNGERTTPTGAAILAAWTEPVDAFPALTIDATGYGAGTRRWPDAPNVLRAVLGRSVDRSDAPRLTVLECNLDDLSPQLLAVALEAALQAGALDAWIAPLTMKKGRPGHLLGALVADDKRAAVEEALFRETSTLGVRAHAVERTALEREFVEVQTAYGPVRVKLGRRGGALVNAAPEFEDCRAAASAHGVPVKEVLAAALAAFRSR